LPDWKILNSFIEKRLKLMNILQISKYFYPAVSFGGPVQSTYSLSKYLVNRGHKVVVYTTDALDISSNAKIQQKQQIIDGIEVHYFPNIAKFYGVFISPSIIQALRKNLNNFDVAHLHEYRTFQNFAFYSVNKNRIPYVLSCHGEYTYRKESWDWSFLRRIYEAGFGQKLVNNASKLHALSEFEVNQYLGAGLRREKIEIIPNGVNPQDFLDISLTSFFRKTYAPNEEKIVLYLGRLHKEKGIDTLVRSFAVLSKRMENVRLVIAGPDDGFLSLLKRIVEELNLDDKVIFTGSLNRKQVLAAYNFANVVVYASFHEGFGIVPLEAGIMGRPVIVSDVPAMDFVKKGKFGLVVKYGNVSQLSEALEKLLTDAELSKEMGENGKKFALEHYSWAEVGKRIEDIYSNISN
jgi:glycosyltransferase involved in cell wall biosynthesis